MIWRLGKIKVEHFVNPYYLITLFIYLNILLGSYLLAQKTAENHRAQQTHRPGQGWN